ncbi:MAG TPA: sigma-70 family RNA polymerase sigma factor [Gemmatimonadales bacterium]|nr:sigma-70 family RNA polymerase sigma factor [Gemmatimonadales bacterium]
MTPAPESGAPEDVDLVAGWRAGDQAAATALVARHTGAVARFLHSSGAPPADLDDLVQEAFFRAFRRIDSWRGDAGFRAWLISIAGNLLRDQWRRRKGRRILPLDDRDLAGADAPDGEVEADEAAERIRAELGRLPRLQREVFLLRVQEGAGYEEIARALGTTSGAARVHYHHAVRRLKERVR